MPAESRPVSFVVSADTFAGLKPFRLFDAMARFAQARNHIESITEGHQLMVFSTRERRGRQQPRPVDPIDRGPDVVSAPGACRQRGIESAHEIVRIVQHGHGVTAARREGSSEVFGNPDRTVGGGPDLVVGSEVGIDAADHEQTAMERCGELLVLSAKGHGPSLLPPRHAIRGGPHVLRGSRSGPFPR
jgi:hypothetical protein